MNYFTISELINLSKCSKLFWLIEILREYLLFWLYDFNPNGIKILVEKQTTIKINGVDKALVAKIAADIKNLKPVEPYKGKGIKERGQFVLRKEGKKK